MHLRSLLNSIAAWLVAVGLYFLVRFYDTQERIDWAETTSAVLTLWILGGIVFGHVDWFSNIMADQARLRQRSYAFLIGFKVSVLFVSLITMSLVALVLVFLRGDLPAAEILPVFLERLTTGRMISATLYLLVATAVMGFVRQMSKMVGPRILLNLTLGRYYFPKVENRIFMFLDLKASTAHAERLGHSRFCELIQDCFRDLTDSAIKHRVEIYKYVGDEAILPWTIKDGVKNFNCLEFFFAFVMELDRRAGYYRECYGIIPEFKAGMNCGPITVAEIGVVKRDIAYLSDVLNTASRIQGKCNELGRRLLISGQVRELLPETKVYQFEVMGSVQLEGREENVKIISVERAVERFC